MSSTTTSIGASTTPSIAAWDHAGEIPLRRAAATAAALSDARLTLDNAAFALAVTSVAHLLQECGVNRGDVVATMLPNRIELIVAMFAAWQLGAALTPLNPALTAREAQYQLDDAHARLVIVDASSQGIVHAGGTRQLSVDDLRLDDPRPFRPQFALTDIALLIYTSGTTGQPKGVMLDHRNVVAMIRMIQAALALQSSDRAMLVLPLFHVNAILISALAPLAAGGSCVVREKFERTSFWRQIAAADATFFSGVPAIYILLTQLPAHPEPPPSRLRFAVCGAAPMPAAAIAQFEARYAVPLLEGYGLTESSVGATLNPLDGPRKAGTVGVPLPGVEIRIVLENGAPAACAAVGEVLLRGPNIMRGYLGRPEETVKTFLGDWLRTGDLGFVDADGYLTLVDRKKDLIIRGGENIYPKEVEQVLCEHPAVQEAAVVGRADPVMGEEAVAFIVARTGAHVDARALLSFARARLAQSKLPSDFRIVEELPRNALGKISKPALKAILRATLRATLRAGLGGG